MIKYKFYEFMLFQNYPNPFNPQTKIRLYIPQHGIVSVKIFSMDGKEIWYQSNYFSSGFHNIIWNAHGFSSGIYSLGLKYNNIIRSVKMIQLK